MCWFTYLIFTPFVLLVLLVGIPSLYAALMSALNTVTIELNTEKDELSYRMGPIPFLPCGLCALQKFLALQKQRQQKHPHEMLTMFGNHRTVTASEIVQLFVNETVEVHHTKRSSYTTRLYTLKAVMKDGHQVLVGQCTRGNAKFVEQEIEAALGIINQRVEGEC
tara:strand:+ start:86 stop:580 length:495 start_codon:yes stop_codon:yes gene_type:complete